MSNEYLGLLFAYAVGFVSAIVCIVPGFPVNRGYQPRRPAQNPDMKLNDFLANAKLPKKSGVPRLCKK